jgi:hypothetical protein
MVDAIVEKRQLLLDSYQQNHLAQLCLFYLNLFHLSVETLHTQRSHYSPVLLGNLQKKIILKQES